MARPLSSLLSGATAAAAAAAAAALLLAAVANCSSSDAAAGNLFVEFLWHEKFSLSDNQTLGESGFLQLLDLLHIGSLHNDTCSSSSSGSSSSSSSDDGHNHRRRRSVGHSEADIFEAIETCLSPRQLAAAVGVNISSGITQQQFAAAAAAIVQQQIGGFCVSRANNTTGAGGGGSSDYMPYLYGSLAVLAISLLSLLGCLLSVCYKATCFSQLMLFFVELAIGSLVGESLLHLLPAVIEGDGHSHSGGGMPGYFPKLVMVCAVFCLMHAVDTFSLITGHEFGHSHGHSHADSSYAVSVQQPELQLQQQQQEQQQQSMYESVRLSQLMKNPKLWLRQPYRLCLFVLVGDGLHNFADGMAIGAAFVLGSDAGLRLSITVALHELAHELADFAILLNSGFSMRAAILLNFTSSLTAFIGLYIAIPLARVTAEMKLWILAITAIMFLYIALVTMVNMIRQSYKPKSLSALLVGNGGLLTGFLCVVAVSMFEFFG